MDSLDRWIRTYDFGERHERMLPTDAKRALGALLETPVGCDAITRALLSARGLGAGHSPIGEFFERAGFEVLERTDAALVVGVSGRPWRPRGERAPFARELPGTVRIAADFRVRPCPGGALLSTETRVKAVDDAARRAFGRYWRLIGPFSALIRRRWLAAAARSTGS